MTDKHFAPGEVVAHWTEPTYNKYTGLTKCVPWEQAIKWVVIGICGKLHRTYRVHQIGDADFKVEFRSNRLYTKEQYSEICQAFDDHNLIIILRTKVATN